MKTLSRVRSDFMRSTDVWLVESESVGDIFRICVTAPTDIALVDSSAKFGALYGLDGDYFAGTNGSIVRQMALAGEIPQTFAISVGYPIDVDVNASLLRNRDLSPTNLPAWDDLHAKMWGEVGKARSGGAGNFLAFLRDELKPMMEQFYPLAPHEATLSGASLGGLFATFCLINAPGAFKRYNIVSPSLWWDKRTVLDATRRFIGQRPALEADVHLSVGAMETAAYNENWIAQMPQEARILMTMFGDVSGWPDMIGDCAELGALLGSHHGGGLRLTSRIVSTETHQTVYSAGLSQALRSLHRTLEKQEAWASGGVA